MLIWFKYTLAATILEDKSDGLDGDMLIWFKYTLAATILEATNSNFIV